MSSQGAVWPAAMALLKSRLDQWQYENWIEPLTLVREEEGAVVLEARNRYSLDWLTEHYLAEIRSAVAEAAGGEREITLTVSKNPTPSPAEIRRTPETPGTKAGSKRGATNPSLESDYIFATFVVGKSNTFAHAAALHVSEKPGKGYNPFFIYSTPGLGKTHLMQAIGHAIHAKEPGKSIVYIRSEDFINELIRSIRHHQMDDFRKRYRKADVLLIDDVHFFGGKEATMEEIFHTFNALLEAKKQIIMTSDRPPKEIRELDKRLLSRFEMGLVADIQPLELETRLAILRQHADVLGSRLPDDVAMFVASNIPFDMREMKGAVNRLLAFSSLQGAPLSLDLAKEVLRDQLAHRHRNQSPEEVIKQVARDLGVKVADLRSKRRSRDISGPRQIIMFILRRITDLSLPAIGELFGGRDHTTVLHAIGKIEERMAENADFKARVDGLMRGFHRG